ncbi:type II secretion system protein [Gemmatimonas sp.]|uniref:pilus assembly FimT family protein n=1 Tax=Gemmatimonas sp. TaxID=1962908 RepID=UPI0022BC47B1|nr:type II secretion system protein [Gemmatimonas sp.]MCZ8204001.1 type II secretion system protein [Gemmatimonas sp.]
MPHVRSHRPGFSMIEILLVIAIIGITATLVLPRVRFDNARVDTAARTIDLVIMAAQRDAVSRQHNVLVVFDTAGGILRTVWDANQNQRAEDSERTRVSPLPDQIEVARPPGVSALAGDSTSALAGVPDDRGPMLLVQRSGSTDRAATFYLTTTRSMLPDETVREVRAVQVSRATGRSAWYTWTGSQWKRAP